MSVQETLEGAVVHLIDKSIAGLDTAVDFLSAEMPVYIEQLLMWYALRGATAALLCLVITLVGLAMLHKVNKGYTAYKSITDEERETHTQEWFTEDYCKCADPSLKAVLYIVGGALLFMLGVIGVFSNIWEPLQIMVAPHVWLVEYATELKAIASN